MNTNTRNYGIDLLRIVSMVMIVTLHVLGAGGLLYKVRVFTLRGEIVWGMEIACFCAVNIYALISGYINANAKFRVANIVFLWLQTVAYLLLFTIVGLLFSQTTVTVWDIPKSFFPVINDRYWYFTGYFALFFFIPALQYLLQNAPRKLVKGTLISCIFFFSLLTTVESVATYYTNGYSVFWLAILYLLGGYLSKYNPLEKVSNAKCFLLYGLCVVLTLASRFVLYRFNARFGDAMADNAFLAVFAIPRDAFVSYVSPTVLLGAICLVQAFSRIRIGDRLKKCVSALSSLTFGVYLIHENRVLKTRFITNRFTHYLQFPVLKMFACVVLTVLIIYACASLIDFCRSLVFKALKIKERLTALEEKLRKRFESKSAERPESEERETNPTESA